MSGFLLIAGPCVIESEKNVMETAQRMKEISDRLKLDYYFKASFDKANRTSITSYRGPGIREGLRILQKVKNEFGLKIATDIHEPWQAEEAAQAADMLQIPDCYHDNSKAYTRYHDRFSQKSLFLSAFLPRQPHSKLSY